MTSELLEICMQALFSVCNLSLNKIDVYIVPYPNRYIYVNRQLPNQYYFYEKGKGELTILINSNALCVLRGWF